MPGRTPDAWPPQIRTCRTFRFAAKKGGEKKADTPQPIVVDRYAFKSDGEGWLKRRYTRLHVFDMASKTSFVLTPGEFFELACAEVAGLLEELIDE